MKHPKTERPRSAGFFMSLACFLLCAAALGAQAESSSPAKAEEAAAKDGTVTRSQGWEVRYGVASYAGAAGNAGAVPADLSRLIGKAESFAVDLFKIKDAPVGENRILGSGEAQGLFPVPLEAAVFAVLDYPNLKAISPRVREVKVLESSASRYYVYEDLGISFMGIDLGYRLDSETYREALPDGAVGVRGHLVKSYDGKLYSADSSWYFREMKLGGVTYTYMRAWSTSGMRNPGIGVAGAMKLFTAGELRDQVNAVAKVAARR
jgi:hypothetical protein